MATFDFVISDSFDTISRFMRRIGFLAGNGDQRLGVVLHEQRVDHLALDVGVLLLGVDADQRVAGLGAAHGAEVTHGRAAQFDVLLGVGHFDQARRVAADEQRLQDLPLHFDGRFLLVHLPQLFTRAHHAQLADGFLPQLRHLLGVGGGQHAGLVAGDHERAQDLALDVDVARAGVDLREHGAVLGRAVDAEVLNRAALHVGIRAALGDRRQHLRGRAASCFAPARTARAPSAAARRCPAGSSRASARPARDRSAAGPGWRAASALRPTRLRAAAPGRRSGAPAVRAPWRRQSSGSAGRS